ncbi:MAG: dCTP deaminase domain-containing protein, partial [Candidatus Ranarchaeia archaeon]
KVTIPQNAIGLVFPRSTLMRIGAMLYTAVWDPGYSGQGLGLFHVFNPHGINVSENARIAQLIFLTAEEGAAHYRGIYQNEKVSNLNKKSR